SRRKSPKKSVSNSQRCPLPLPEGEGASSEALWRWCRLRVADFGDVPGVRSGDVFIDISTPPRTFGDGHIPVFDLWHSGRQLILPGHIVDIDLHDADVG